MWRRLCQLLTPYRSLRSWAIQGLETDGHRYFCNIQADIDQVNATNNGDLFLTISNVTGHSPILDDTPNHIIIPSNMVGMPEIAKTIKRNKTINVEVNPENWIANRINALHWIVVQHGGYVSQCCERINGFDIYIVGCAKLSPLQPLFIPDTVKDFDIIKRLLTQLKNHGNASTTTKIRVNLTVRKGTHQVESLQYQYTNETHSIQKQLKQRFQAFDTFNNSSVALGLWVHVGNPFLKELFE